MYTVYALGSSNWTRLEDFPLHKVAGAELFHQLYHSLKLNTAG